MIPRRTHSLWLALGLFVMAGCSNPTQMMTTADSGTTSPEDAPTSVTSTPVDQIPGHDAINQDNAPKNGPRLMSAEAYIRSYLQLFGGLTPLQAQTRAQAGGLFDTWNDYLTTLGMPDYSIELSRNTQTNALMLATFERVGIALCDRTVESEIQMNMPVARRTIFPFDVPATQLTLAAFSTRFDQMHRTFLGYPASQAPAERTASFLELYHDTFARHSAAGAARANFAPAEAAWATVCYGLIRHPEFHLY